MLPPIERDSHIILDLYTPTSSIEHWVVPKSLGKMEYRDARNSGRKTMSMFVAIKDPYGDGVGAIVKDKTTTFPEGKKAARL
ncbi:hypothetical protein HOY80DRAFT_1066132 [Tuber brumale]|nr:hypothetical protein HOY80DRAFT_1066132 [Tuber brumale]